VRYGDVWLCVLAFADEASLLRLSAVDRACHASVTRGLFREDTCVHCGATFCALDNRQEGCLKIFNKSHRRHKGSRRASRRERRHAQTLIANRKRISSEDWKPDAVATKETCARCARQYLPWRVSDDQWRATVPRRYQSRTLCFRCYGRFSSSSPLLSSAGLLLAGALFFFALAALRRWPLFFHGRRDDDDDVHNDACTVLYFYEE